MKLIIIFSVLLNIAIIGQDEVITEKVIDDKIELKLLPLKKQNDQLEKKLLVQNKIVDSLNKKLYDYEKLLFNIADSLKINTSNFQIMKSETNQQIDNINESISRQALYWIIGILAALLLSVIVFFFLKSKLAKNTASLDTQIEITRHQFESESIKLDTKLVELLEKQLKISAVDKSISIGNDRAKDHSLAKRVGEEIHRMRNRIATLPQDIKGITPLVKSLERLESQFNDDGYELINLIGRPFTDGLAVKAIFIPSDDLLKDERKITKVIKPQINFKGQIIQESEIEVSVGN
jgi:hypothetical protein